jgi:Na+/melibiose symporter-like transporter
MLLFLPNVTITTNGLSQALSLAPNSEIPTTTIGFSAAIAVNFLILVLSFVCIFLYKKRSLQLNICYTLIIFSLILLLMLLFCPFTKNTNPSDILKSYYPPIFSAIMMLDAFIAAKLIKKDIELLKSADRIR